MELEERLEVLQQRLGHRWTRPQLLVQAVTHRSYANEHGLPDHYERLEFLGDSVLGLITARWLYRAHPELPEGQLSRLMSYLVSEPVLADLARRLELGECLQLGVGEERSGGRAKPSLLADCLEAVLGALFLDAGLAAARRLVEPLLEQAVDGRPALQLGDAKTRLQELAQAQGLELPEYRHVSERGPDHRKDGPGSPGTE